jgi:hypothetical protein
MPRPTLLIGRRLVNVAGESHYQDALRQIAGEVSENEPQVRHTTEAILEPEPENPHDPNAVVVRIDGHKVGYLPRTEAVAYGPVLRALADRGRAGAAEAVIAGRNDAGTSNLGVFLRLPDPDEPQRDPDPARRW